MSSTVLLAYTDGRKEFIPAAHVHGYRGEQLLIASGAPGAGLSADIVRVVDVTDLDFVETCGPQVDLAENGPEWFMGSGD